jgi:adenylate kinase
MKRILIMGPQGSGKGTQAELLAKRLNIPALSMGQLLRDEIAQKTDLGMQIDGILKSGNLVSDKVAIEVLKRRLEADDAKMGYILDGYPRNMEQYEASKVLPEPTDIIVIEVPLEESLARMKKRAELEKRDDDNPEAMKKRLEIYELQTKPLINAYREITTVHEVNGIGSVDEIHENIMKLVNNYGEN